MYHARDIGRLLSGIALVIVSAGALFLNPASAQEPDFGDVEDILGGRGTLLAADDIVVSLIGEGNDPWVNKVLLTSDLKVSSNTTEEVVADTGCNIPFFITKIGRVFDLPNDVTVSLAPRNVCEFPDVALYVKNPRNPSQNGATLFSAGSTVLSMELADFDGDGYDEALVSDQQQGGFPVTLRVFDAKSLKDPVQGFKQVGESRFSTSGKSPRWEPVVADLNGDGNLEVAWVDGGTIDVTKTKIKSLVHIVTICAANLSSSGGACSGRSAYTFIEAPSLEVDVDLVPIAFDRFLAIEKILLTAGNYDGKLSASGRLDEELFVAVIPRVNSTTGQQPPEVNTLIPMAYDFDQDLIASNSPSNDWSKNPDPKMIIGNTNIGGWNAVDSGSLDWFGDAEQVILASASNDSLVVPTLTFGADLSMNLPTYFDVRIP